MGSLNVPVLWRYVFSIRPTSWQGAWRYYRAVLWAVTGRLLGGDKTVSGCLQGPLDVRCDGIVFGVRPNTEDLSLAALSADALTVTRFFRPRTDDVVIDVGANVGGYALRAGLVGALVIAIEPEPSNYRQLVDNVRANHLSSVRTFQLGLSDRSGSGFLRLASTSGGHSLETRAWGVPTGEEVPVELKTLDEIIGEADITRIDWLKIDVERHELAVLRGAIRSLAITENLILEFELSRLAVISDLLKAAGLKIHWHDGRENAVLMASRSR